MLSLCLNRHVRYNENNCMISWSASACDMLFTNAHCLRILETLEAHGDIWDRTGQLGELSTLIVS